MERNDIQGEVRAPQAIAAYLLRKGGKNEYGEPIFRLVWAPIRMTLKGGRFNDWDANIAAHERGGMVKLKSGLLVSNGYRPNRTVTEVRSVVKYLGVGDSWALERFMPRAYYGNRGEWEDRVVPGTTVPLMGPFPVQGDYEMCGSYGEIPSIAQLEEKIDRCEFARSQHKGTTASMIADRLNRFEEENAAQEAKELAEAEARMRDLLKPLWGTSLNAGILRNQLAAQAGIREHVGN